MRPSSAQTIREFHALYSGGLAAERRAEGVADIDAMPPWAETYWLGKQVVKCPMDLWVYQEILWECKPDVLIETGTSGSGSAYFFASIMDRIGHGRVVTVDIDEYPHLRSDHPRITYLVGSSIAPEIVSRMASAAQGKVMVSLDSLHTYEYVRAELEAYARLVTPGQYLVVEDTGCANLGETATTGDWCNRAVSEFLAANPSFAADLSRERHLLTSNGNGWIRRNA